MLIEIIKCTLYDNFVVTFHQGKVIGVINVFRSIGMTKRRKVE